MDRNVIETGEDEVTKCDPMLTWVNDSFSQIAGVKGDDETGDSLHHRKGDLKRGGLVKKSGDDLPFVSTYYGVHFQVTEPSAICLFRAFMDTCAVWYLF